MGILALAVYCLLGWVGPVRGAMTPEQKKQVEEIRKDLGRVPGLIAKKDVEEAEKLLEELESRLRAIGKESGEEDNKLLTGLLRQIEQRRGGLSKRAATAGPAFEKEVAPILVKNCLGCHDETASGGLRFDTFGGIVAGCGGKLVVPGNPQASILIQRLLVNGEARMPKGQKALPAEDLRKITAWIAGGARFGGQNDIPLANLSAGLGPKKEAAPVAIAMASGNERVSFKRDIAPFMVNLCVGCHGGANPRDGFSLDTFEKLMRGGKNGRVVLPGNTEDSRLWHLVGKQDPIKMPMGQARITRTNWNNLRTWIEEGAKFDGTDPKAPLRSLVPTEAEERAAELAKLTPEEWLAQRVERANRLWKAALPQETPNTHQTENVVLLGNVPGPRLEQYGQWADEAAGQIAKVFHAREQPLWKGKLTLFIFSDRFTYAEFVQTNEGRELLNEISAHARVRPGGEDAYVCLLDVGDEPGEESPGAKAIVLAEMTEAFLQRSGAKIPEWVSKGTGLALAARSDPKNDYFKKLAADAGHRLLTLAKPEDLMKDGTFSPADLGPVGYSLVAHMLKQGEPQYVNFVGQLLAGKSLDESLKAVYNADAVKVAVSYLSSATARTPPRKNRK